MIIPSSTTMAFCSFASLVGRTCGPSPENPNVVDFVDLKNFDRDVKAHLKLCNILTNVETVNSERKLLLARAGRWKCAFLFNKGATVVSYIMKLIHANSPICT